MTADDTVRHRCPRCGRFTRGHAVSGEGSSEAWYWRCVCGARGEEGY